VEETRYLKRMIKAKSGNWSALLGFRENQDGMHQTPANRVEAGLPATRLQRLLLLVTSAQRPLREDCRFIG
jgi:hypothetical protein